MPEPGETSLPSSSTIITPGFMLNLAVFAGLSLEDVDEPIPPSVDPIASIKTMSLCLRSPSFTSELHITPLEIIVCKLSIE